MNTDEVLTGSDLNLARAAVTDCISGHDPNADADWLTGLQSLLPRLAEPLTYHDGIVLVNALFNYDDPNAAGADPYPNASEAGYELIDRVGPHGLCPACGTISLTCEMG